MQPLFKTAVIALVCQSLVAGTAHAQATFLDDFYSQAGAAVNVTPGQVMSTQSGAFITGGSVVWRVPQRTFQPFLWQSPSIRAGCGGIDVFMGSFGFANSSQFVDYLRNIGQNALGLFFKMALQSMSPDLHNVLTEISKDIQDMNGKLGNSCQMAENALNGLGITKEWMKGIVKQAKGADVADGSSTGMYDADQRFKTDLGRAITKVDSTTPPNSGGKPVVGAQKNFLWAALNAGVMSDLPDSMKEVAMSMIGTEGAILNPSDPNGMLPIVKSTTIRMEEMVGRFNMQTVSLSKYRCLGTDDKCLDMTVESVQVKPFARMAYENLLLIRNSILQRRSIMAEPGGPQALQMLGVTKLPVYKVLELTASPGRVLQSNDFIEKYADLIGYELAIAFVESFTLDLEKSLNSSKQSEQTKGEERYLTEVRGTLKRLRDDARAVRVQIDMATGGQEQLVATVERLERTIYTTFSNRLMENLKYASKG